LLGFGLVDTEAGNRDAKQQSSLNRDVHDWETQINNTSTS
jgi:hypothetical protein